MRLIRRTLAAVALSGLVAGPVQAADDPAVKTVESLYASFDGALKSGAKDVKARADAIGPAMKESFDFPAMVRVAVGPKWKAFTPEQQGALTEAFTQYFTTTYANRLAQAAGGKFEVTPQVEARGSSRVVHTKVANAQGEDSQIDFLLNPGNRVQDVLLNGDVSEVASQRTLFSDPIKAGGAEALLKFLRERTAGMLAAKPAP
ncbi:MlaC/ttg2D family ABC transporter substrate-binding protein [Methylobacterium planeticum]|uniref:ABC transporter substrate-binding protein n=1 Tax=Methylobacterium planeticum TaxID=2615211 RepID=A0A6N6N021_9HYPH|nr:ABC transporter substrate-binding protein [Methylobacterium planeticum]KAB1076304.1 ABC transporter substrate-binding protein [Methylobacterium planeticum]